MANIEVKSIQCPCCGSNVELKDNGYGEMKCQYCNAIIFIDREDTDKNGDMIIYSKDENRPLASINMPLGWNIIDSFVNYAKGTLEIPYGICVDLDNGIGSAIHIETGNSFQEIGVGITASQANHTIQKPFETVDKYLDEYVAQFAVANKSNAIFVEELKIPIDSYDKTKEFNDYKEKVENEAIQFSQTSGTKTSIHTVYCDSACRVYEVGDKVLVAYTKEFGYMSAIAGFGFLNNGINNLMQGFGNVFGNRQNNQVNNNNNDSGNILNKMADSGLLGGMLGKKYRTQQNTQESVNMNQNEEEQVVEHEVEEVKQDNGVLIGNFRTPGPGESSTWQSDCIFLLITSKEEYKDIYEKAYKQVCSSFKLAPEVVNEYRQIKMQWEAENQNTMSAQAAAQRANGDRLIQMGQQRMSNNQAYIESMMNRSNKQYHSQRDSYNSRIASQDRMREKTSEAIRGVNTYIRPDGKEVEVPVSADTAWINGKGEIIGGSAGFNPGSGWTKMEKKN